MHDESDHLAGPPERFNYIRDVVMKYTRPGRGYEKRWQSFIDSLSYEQLGEIAKIYRQIAAQEDAEPLSAWVQERKPEVTKNWDAWQDAQRDAEKHGTPVPPEPQQEPRARRLFELFDYLLKEKRVPPFNSGDVEFCPPPIKLDWSKLPRELDYLMKPAKEHGVLWGEDAWWKASKIIKARMPEVFEELKEVNARLYSTPGEWQRIDAFLNQYPIHLHQEAARVRSLLMLLDCLFDRP